MRQNADFIHSTCFGHHYAHHQEYKPGSFLCCVALAVGCVYCSEDMVGPHLPSTTHIQQQYTHPTAVHTSNSSTHIQQHYTHPTAVHTSNSSTHIQQQYTHPTAVHTSNSSTHIQQ